MALASNGTIVDGKIVKKQQTQPKKHEVPFQVEFHRNTRVVDVSGTSGLLKLPNFEQVTKKPSFYSFRSP